MELGPVTKESTGMDYNEKVYGSVLFVNARARPSGTLTTLVQRPNSFVAQSEGSLVAARVSAANLKPGVISAREAVRLAKNSDGLEAPADSLFNGYWDMVESNGLAIADQARRFEESLPISGQTEVRGPPSNLMIEAGADLESHLTFDARLGPIIIRRGAVVESFSRIMGPCYIGPKTKVFSAQIGGGTSIFESCKVGGQVENSIIMPHTNKAHHGYVGDSYVGEWVNLGAGSTFSNLKNTYGNVRLDVGGKRLDTGMLKLGPLVGDMCKVSIGALAYAGKTLGTGSQVSGLASSNVPSFTYLDGTRREMVELLVDSVVDTQRRMMDRRGLVLTRAFEGLIRKTFSSTAGERRSAGVKKGKIR